VRRLQTKKLRSDDEERNTGEKEQLASKLAIVKSDRNTAIAPVAGTNGHLFSSGRGDIF
jgi:hypothetical protein